MIINLNVFNGTVNCGGQYTLTHVIETIEANSWYVCVYTEGSTAKHSRLLVAHRDSDTITFNAAAAQRVYGTITLTGTGANGYQSGDGRCVGVASSCRAGG